MLVGLVVEEVAGAIYKVLGRIRGTLVTEDSLTRDEHDDGEAQHGHYHQHSEDVIAVELSSRLLFLFVTHVWSVFGEFKILPEFLQARYLALQHLIEVPHYLSSVQKFQN